MTKQEQVKTPELDKMLAVNKDSQKIGEFLEWLAEQEIILTREDDKSLCELYEIRESNEQLLADYFVIDLVKCKKERQALLKAVQEDNS